MRDYRIIQGTAIKWPSTKKVFTQAAFLLALLLVGGGSVLAQYPYRYPPQYYPRTSPSYYGRDAYFGGLTDFGSRVAEERGYRVGVERGRDDAWHRRAFNLNHSEHFRDGDSGYDPRFGSLAAYRSLYREAFRRGYEQGFSQYSRSSWRW